MHRFTRTETTADGATRTVADDEYAQLSLAMRGGIDAGAVFDAPLARDQIRVHSTDAERVSALTGAAVDAPSAGVATVVVADTNEQVAALNAALRVGRLDFQRRRAIIAESVTLVRSEFVFGTPKGHERREVPIPLFLLNELTEHVAGKQPSDLVFCGT